MAVPTANLSWLDFVFQNEALLDHLKRNGRGQALELLAQFVENADKWRNVDQENGSPEPATSTTFDHRARKSQALKQMALQTAAFLYWNLEIFSDELKLVSQDELMKVVKTMDEKNLFLKVLYHRWILRIDRMKSQQYWPQGEKEVVILNAITPAESVNELCKIISLLANSQEPVLVPTPESILSPETDISNELGEVISSNSFVSMINIDLGVYFLYKGQVLEARKHFQSQTYYRLRNFPYLTISEAKFDGYRIALSIPIGTPETKKPMAGIQKKTLGKVKQAPGTHNNRGGTDQQGPGKDSQAAGTEKRTDLEEFISADVLAVVKHESLHGSSRDEGLLLEPGILSWDSVDPDTSTELYKRIQLVETKDVGEIREALTIIRKEFFKTKRSLRQLFSRWPLPTPLLHAINELRSDLYRETIHFVLAKSEQFKLLNAFGESRLCLELALDELKRYRGSGHTQNMSTGMHFGNVARLCRMLTWEILLVDIWEFFYHWPKPGPSEFSSRMKGCLGFSQNPQADVKPRTEIIENCLIALINLYEFEFVSKFPRVQQHWPFLEFLVVLAQCCLAIMESRHAASTYRDLWNAVLPFCISKSRTGVRRTPLREGILANSDQLIWILDRSKCTTLVELFVSLFSRLLNFMASEGGLEIRAAYLHFWPTILDDITETTSVETKAVRVVSASSRLSGVKIRGFLFQILEVQKGLDKLRFFPIAGDAYLVSSQPELAMASYLEYLAQLTDNFENFGAPCWKEDVLFERMILCCQNMKAYLQALILCQFLTRTDYDTAFEMANEIFTVEGWSGLYEFIWDVPILEQLTAVHATRKENQKKEAVIKVLRSLELNPYNSGEIKVNAICLRKKGFMQSLTKFYVTRSFW